MDKLNHTQFRPGKKQFNQCVTNLIESSRKCHDKKHTIRLNQIIFGCKSYWKKTREIWQFLLRYTLYIYIYMYRYIHMYFFCNINKLFYDIIFLIMIEVTLGKWDRRNVQMIWIYWDSHEPPSYLMYKKAPACDPYILNPACAVINSKSSL